LRANPATAGPAAIAAPRFNPRRNRLQTRPPGDGFRADSAPPAFSHRRSRLERPRAKAPQPFLHRLKRAAKASLSLPHPENDRPALSEPESRCPACRPISEQTPFPARRLFRYIVTHSRCETSPLTLCSQPAPSSRRDVMRRLASGRSL